MDVLVIGAGVIGASIADALAEHGARVTVIDMRSPGRGASQASAGLLTPYIEGRAASPLLDLCAEGLTRWAPFAERLRSRSDVPFIYEREGTLEVALTPEEAARLTDMSAWLSGLHVDAQWMDGDQARRLEPAVSPNAIGGLLIPCQGFVAVSSLVKAIVQSARLGGAVFEEPVEAVRVDSGADHVTVHADARIFTADAVVVAAGAWSGRVKIAGSVPIQVRPMRGQLLELRWTGSDLPTRPVWGGDCYTVPWKPDRLLVGATLEDVGFDERTTVDGIRGLLDAVASLLPGAGNASFESARVGLRPATADHLPIIGPLPGLPRVCVAAGHYRNGILLAPLTAEMIVGQLMDGRIV
jgi:glycine oxidase